MNLYSTLNRRSGFSTNRMPSLFKALAVLRQRRALARLDNAALADLGLTRADVSRELKRPIWDVPSNWRG
ncbi:DUF1127 domain-containing protein [Shimia sp.]|uniref:DUF1127 domain-containing protein n=1 Tax=Shimia sp. TaxID=1954381 RepID=UPI003299B2BB